MKENIRIMKTPPPITDEEINSFMDFDDLLRKKNVFDRSRHQLRRVRNLTLILVAAVALPSALWLCRDKPQSRSGGGENKLKQPKVVAAKPRSPDTLDLHAPENQMPSGRERTPKTGKSGPAKLKMQQSATLPAVIDTAGAQPVYVQAEPTDGYPALYNYFSKNLRYPLSAVGDSVEGVVTVAFIIDLSGKAKQIVVENSLGTEFDKEVVRLMENMPLWKPASYGGKPVQSKISLPITFNLVRKPNP